MVSCLTDVVRRQIDVEWQCWVVRKMNGQALLLHCFGIIRLFVYCP
jgi:hypothetical protein